MIPIIFRDEVTVDGVRYYVRDDESLTIADTWDALFKPKSTGKPVANRKYKGQNPDKRRAYLKGEKSY